MGMVCGCQIVSEPIDAETVRRSVEDLAREAVVVYCAEIPATHQGAPVDTLTLAADGERALLQMFGIADEAVRRWDANVAILQRLGELIPGDTALVVAVACADHRHSFECCRHVADLMAERVPVRVE